MSIQLKHLLHLLHLFAWGSAAIFVALAPIIDGKIHRFEFAIGIMALLTGQFILSWWKSPRLQWITLLLGGLPDISGVYHKIGLSTRKSGSVFKAVLVIKQTLWSFTVRGEFPETDGTSHSTTATISHRHDGTCVLQYDFTKDKALFRTKHQKHDGTGKIVIDSDTGRIISWDYINDERKTGSFVDPT